MALGYMTALGGTRYVSESAGLTASQMTDVEMEVMKEDGLRTDYPANTVFTCFNEGKVYDHVISICDGKEEPCSVYAGNSVITVWSFDDPAFFEGTQTEQLAQTREVRDSIKRKVEQFILAHADGV